jgi:lysophospholipase L1-like esterase
LARRYRLVGIPAAACATLALLGAGSPAPAQTAASPPYYLALGDSLAAGMQPDGSGADRPTNHGYVNVVARSLARQNPGLVSKTLSCGGATSVTLLHGGESCQPDGDPGQLTRAEQLLAARPNTKLVTLDIGDNDLEACINRYTGAANATCLKRGEATVRKNLPVIARRLRAAAPRSARVIGLVDYDQFLSLWLNGAQGRAAARRSLAVIGHLNQFVSEIYRSAGLEVADAGARFSTQNMTTRRVLPGYGSVPLNVYKICTLTWACSASHDDHARPSGYYQLGEAILDVLHTQR